MKDHIKSQIRARRGLFPGQFYCQLTRPKKNLTEVQQRNSGHSEPT